MPESVIIYTDLFRKLEMLSDHEMGVFFRAILKTAMTGEAPVFDDEKLVLAWNFVGDQLQRDIKKYEDKISKQKENAKRAGLASAAARAELARLTALEKRAAEIGLGIDVMTPDERARFYGNNHSKNMDDIPFE